MWQYGYWLLPLWSVTVDAAIMVTPMPMNPVNYTIANPASPRDAIRAYRGEFFEVYGPPRSNRYSEVNWNGQYVSLPPDIVQRFDGKVMAITGYEVNIVRQHGNGTD